MKKERQLPIGVVKQYECGKKPVIVFKCDEDKEPVRLTMGILIGKDNILAPGSLTDFVEADIHRNTAEIRKEIMSDSFKLNKDTNHIYSNALKNLNALNNCCIETNIYMYLKNFLSLALKDIYDKLILNESINFNKLKDNYQYLFSEVLHVITCLRYPVIVGSIIDFNACIEYMNYLNLSYEDIESSDEFEEYIKQTYVARILLNIYDKATTEIISYINPDDISDNSIAFVVDVVTEVLVEWKNTLTEIFIQLVKEFTDPMIYRDNRLLNNFEKIFYDNFDTKDTVSQILNGDADEFDVNKEKMKRREWRTAIQIKDFKDDNLYEKF